MHIIVSPTKDTPSRGCNASEMNLDRDPVFNQKRKELLNLFSAGMTGFNYCMAQMYILGRQQEKAAKFKRSNDNVVKV